MTNRILLAGFGGQGVLFAGKQLANAALNQDLFVTWLPSYGPEMRGGTANCSVIVSDQPIGAPIVTQPDILIAMNKPSYLKFYQAVAADGILLYDSSLIELEEDSQPDGRVKIIPIPATQIADENGLKGLANVVMLGKLLAETGLFALDYFEQAMAASIPASKAKLIGANKTALHLGYSY